MRKGIPGQVVERKGIRIPAVLLTSPDKLPHLFTTHSEKAFDLYLILKRISKETGSNIIQPIDYKYLANAIHYSGKEGGGADTSPHERSDYYFYLRMPMQALKEKLGVINHVPWSKKLEIVDMHEKDDYFVIPFEYFEYGLDADLLFGEKVLYLISLLEAKRSQGNPCWFRSHKDIGKGLG